MRPPLRYWDDEEIVLWGRAYFEARVAGYDMVEAADLANREAESKRRARLDLADVKRRAAVWAYERGRV